MTDPNAIADAIDPRMKELGDVWSPAIANRIAASDLLRAQSKALSAIETYLASWGSGNAPEAQTILDVIGGMVRDVEEKKL
jgi:hypothetical protein